MFASPGARTNLAPVRPIHSARASFDATKSTCPNNAASNARRPVAWSSSCTAEISWKRYGCPRITPCPKMIIERVRMLAPSTVIAIGVCW